MTGTKQMLANKAENFLNMNSLAIIGVSTNPRKFGNLIFKELKQKNVKIYQVHHSGNILNSEKTYRSINDIPEPVNGVILNVQSSKTLDTIKDLHSKGINNFWIQKGSESREALEFVESNSINCISGKCILMFANPVNSIHKFHRVLWNIFSKN